MAYNHYNWNGESATT